MAMPSFIAVTGLSVLLIGAGIVYSGVIDVGADEPHSPAVLALLETARERSIAVRASRLQVPDLEDEALIRSGAGNYDSMCIGCHLAPGMSDTELSQNLYPAPPKLAERDTPGDPAAAFWVIKHGIKATGMPAWGKSMDDQYIWGMVALLQRLPRLDAEQYRALVAESDGHQHGGGETEMHDHRGQHETEQAAVPPSAETEHQSHAPEPAPARQVHHHANGSQHVH